MCKIETKQLDQMIFMLDHICEDDEIVIDNLIKKSSEIQKDDSMLLNKFVGIRDNWNS